MLLEEGTFTFGARSLSFLLPLSGLVNPFPLTYLVFHLMWKMKITKKVKFLVWQVLHGRVSWAGWLGRCLI